VQAKFVIVCLVTVIEILASTTCRKRADALHGKNSSFKSQVINCFHVFVTIITSKIMACLISVLQLDRPYPQTHQSFALSKNFGCKATTIVIAIFGEILQHILKYTSCKYILIFNFVMLKELRVVTQIWGAKPGE
jgi:hypothetical protein